MNPTPSLLAVLVATSIVFVFSSCTPEQESAPPPPEQEHKRLAIPPTIIDPPWLEKRRQTQLQTSGKFEVFHDFAFSDQVEKSGIRFRHMSVEDAGKHWKPVHYDHGSGLAVADVDGDHLLDIYFVNQVGENQLWRNLGSGKFENITHQAGVALAEPIGVGASFADIDNDADPDLYVTTVRAGNVLFENDGTGRFRDISAESGLNYKGHSSGAVFFDYNRDGLLDLFLTNIGTYTKDELITVHDDAVNKIEGGRYSYYLGLEDAFSGHLYPERTERSILFENRGDNRFVDVSEAVGLVDTSWSGDASPLDLNEDGWPDLYLLNMQGNDEYFENVAGKRFVKKSRELFPMTPWGSMGIAIFDFDNDGLMDIYATDMHSDMAGLAPTRVTVNYKDEKSKAWMFYPKAHLRTEDASIFGNAFYHNLGDQKFAEISDQIGAENFWPWGLSPGDLNADGYQDIFIASSMNFPWRYGVNSVLLNNRGKKFLDSEFILKVEPRRDSRTAKPWFELDCGDADREHLLCKGKEERFIVWGALGTRSSTIFDLDEDGDLDIVTNDFNSEPMVLISDLSEKKADMRYLKIELIGTSSNRSGLGARIEVKAGAQVYTRVHDGKSGYLSQSLMPLYFGLEEAKTVDQITVHWPSGQKQMISAPIATNTLLQIREQ